MQAYYFTEMPYPYFPVELEKELKSSRVVVPNKYCDPKIAGDLYNRYLDEYLLADDLGLNIMLNEHHANIGCLDSVVPLPAAILARQTRQAKIAIVGTPLVHRHNPVRVAEELAFIDCVSGGRLISGFVRGVGTEVHPANTNPVLQRQRMEEAHDLILKAWSEPEPFNWEGRFFNYRYVNIWPTIYQKPHPPIWVTGSTTDGIPWVADHGYTFACFLTPYDHTEMLVNFYRRHREEHGLTPPTEDNFAYLALCYTGETEEEAQETGRGLMWYLERERHPYFFSPPGYTPYQSVARQMIQGGGRPIGDSYESLQTKGIVIAGTPKTMIEKIKYLHDRCNIGHLMMMNQAGDMPTEKVRRSLELFAKEVYPAIKDLAPADNDATPTRSPVS